MNAFTKIFALLIMCASLTLFTACGDENNEPVNETVHPLGEAKSDHGHFTVLAIHDPVAPVAGEATLTLTITDPHDGNSPLEGLNIIVTPWMPAHGHGSNKTPIVTDKSAGVYEIKDVVYTMPGDWEARITIQKLGLDDDTITFGFSVK